jgi:hypothetical protein
MTDMTPPDRPATVTLRLTLEMRLELERRADECGLSISDYIRRKVFEAGAPLRRRRRHTTIKDHKAFAHALALLGQSRIANNLNQLTAAAHIGALPVTPDIEADLREAVAHVAAIRTMLIAALDLSDGAP